MAFTLATSAKGGVRAGFAAAVGVTVVYWSGRR
jgi:threonine/homoserine/homoserine lactone efflux protein